jgi:hypothetical protein
MIRLYKEGTMIECNGIKMDHRIFQDDEAEQARNDGWTSALEVSQRAKGEKVFDSIDTNDTGKLSVDEVREAAKAAGIEGWDTKRIKTLKRELGVDGD